MVRTLTVRRRVRLPGETGPRGHVKAGLLSVPCALGHGGISYAKREGDGATPAGHWRLMSGFFRPDRLARPFCRVPLTPLPGDLGWCDDPASPLYNRSRKLPMSPSHEVMWRQDGLYDIVFVLDYNLNPRRSGRGSAVFLHCARPGFPATLGCVALRPEDLRRLLPRLALEVRVVVI